MAPKEKADGELGSVVPTSGSPPYRVEVKLDGKTICGPKRQERCHAEADLKAMRARPRSEMAETLKALATGSKQPRHINATIKRPSHSNESLSSVVHQPSDVADRMTQTLTLKGICVQYPFSRLMQSALDDVNMRAKDIEVRSFPMAPARGSQDFCHPYVKMFLIETLPQGPADVSRVASGDSGREWRGVIPPPPKRAQVIGALTFGECTEYDSKAAFREDAARHRILPGSKHDWDGTGRRYAWEIIGTTLFWTPVPASSHNMYGFQTPTTLTVQYAHFSDVLKHTEGVDQPVAVSCIIDLVLERMATILPSWPVVEGSEIPAPGDANEACLAELYILWLLEGLSWQFWCTFTVHGWCDEMSATEATERQQRRYWDDAERTSERGHAAAETLRQRLLAEYWACAGSTRQEILREISALLLANRTIALSEFLDECAERALPLWKHQHSGDVDQSGLLQGFHQLHVAPMNPKLRMINMLLVTEQSARHSLCHHRTTGVEEPDKTNQELLEILAEPENKPAILGHLCIGGLDFVTPEWFNSDE